jgi:hypothetical protein
VNSSLQPLLEHPRLKALGKQLPSDPRLRLGLAASGLALLVLLVYLMFR